MSSVFLSVLGISALCHTAVAALPGTRPLTENGDRSAQMVAGISRFLDRQIESAAQQRPQQQLDPITARKQLRKAVGAVDSLLSFEGLQFISNTTHDSIRYHDAHMEVHAVRWPVFKNVHGEGLLITPTGSIRARVMAIPDADQTPEQVAGIAPGIKPESQFGRRLAVAGCQVVIPTLINRSDEFSGSDRVAYTNQTHREWIYRQAFEMGRHVIGYEVRKIEAILNWFEAENTKTPDPVPIGLIGYNEGGLLALHTAALNPRVHSTLVSGYFNARNQVWKEPIYRNIFGQLNQLGDAELATLISPSTLVIEHAAIPTIPGPPTARPGRRSGAAPGVLKTPPFASVSSEVQEVTKRTSPPLKHFFITADGKNAENFAGKQSLELFLKGLQVTPPANWHSTKAPAKALHRPIPQDRQKRMVRELEEHTQQLLRFSEYRRNEQFWKSLDYKQAENWHTHTQPHRKHFSHEVIGEFQIPDVPPNPRSRKILETEKWNGYEVTLDVWKDIFAWGYLLLPKDIKPNERRPVVVCQHGLEGLPMDTITRDQQSRAFRAYKGFAAELANRGFVVFAPHNPYRGQDAFRVLQRKANPLGKSLFSIIVPQHNRILDWLETQPYIDKKRIGFYGLSYGGKSAMRIPALEPRYCLSICSADFNEWIRKNTTVDARYSYIFTGEYEIFEYDLGHTFNYAEMAALIAPRPFMVERGHHDGVAPDEWVAYEFAKVRRLYAQLKIPERTEIEYFNGPHTINGQATYAFLHRHLNWPEPKK